MIWRRSVVVIPVALLLAFFAIRAMAFSAPRNHPLSMLRPFFPAYTDQLIERGMSEIGSAAAKATKIPAIPRLLMARAARQSPLAIEPFLVEGTVAQMDGAGSRAEALFLAAQARNPRAPAPRYFLADRYLRTNRIGQGLAQMSALSRLVSNGSQPLGPALAAYAQTPGAVPELRRFFATSPGLRDMTLSILANDIANAPLIMSLAPQGPVRQSPPPEWQGRLVRSLITAGNYSAADFVWRRITGITDRGLLHNPNFRDKSAPPPFNWQLTSGSAGVAEASATGGLDVIYYGREEVVLATQIVLLAPGQYSIAMRIKGASSASGLAWSISCITTNAELLRLPLEGEGKGAMGAAFTVPSTGCGAQNIELRGRPGDEPQTAQLTIFDLNLQPLAAKS